MISVIIPCYNAPLIQLENALKSIYSQSFTDYEIIVVDDGSLPEYHQILEDVCAGRPKLRMLTKENGGVSTARNTGVAAAQGEYITFLDADDMFVPNFLQRAYDLAIQTNTDMVIGGVIQLESLPANNIVIQEAANSWKLYTEKEMESLKTHFLGGKYLLRYENGYISRGPVARLLKTKIAQKTAFDPELSLGEDLVWNLRLMNCCQRVCIVYETWYYYWINPSSATHRFSPKVIDALQALFIAIQSQIDMSKDEFYLSYADKVKEDSFLAWHLYLERQRKENRAVYKHAVHDIYTQPPWNVLGEKRLFSLSHMKGKLWVLAYRLHLWFFLFSIKERLKKRWKNC